MNVARYITLVLPAVLLLPSCEKNTVSKIPQISLIAFIPDTAMTANVDTPFIIFSFVDGDADIGNDTLSSIYIKDSRDSAHKFVVYPFPFIDGAIEDPKKGLQGKCIFFPDPPPIPRPDSIHTATGDTLTYEFYIKDRAGNSSNHIVTHQLIIRP
jgi:hypothetical protein